jgi:hypothetical protein
MAHVYFMNSKLFVAGEVFEASDWGAVLVSSGNGVISCPQPHIRNDDRHRRWHAKRAIGLFVKKKRDRDGIAHDWV